MKKIFHIFIFVSIIASAQAQPGDSASVLIVYHSVQGHTREMAQAVAKGAKEIVSVKVKLIAVQDATNNDVLAADAIIIGSPVYNANVAPQIMQLINAWPFEGEPMRDKIGAAFVSAGGISAGEELVQMSILQSMLIFNMIVVGGGNWQSAFGASAVVEEELIANLPSQNKVHPHFLKKGKALGRRVAELAHKLKHKNNDNRNRVHKKQND